MKKLTLALLILVGCSASPDMPSDADRQYAEGELIMMKGSGDILYVTDCCDYKTEDPDRRYWVREFTTYEDEPVNKWEFIWLDKNVKDFESVDDIQNFLREYEDNSEYGY